MNINFNRTEEFSNFISKLEKMQTEKAGKDFENDKKSFSEITLVLESKYNKYFSHLLRSIKDLEFVDRLIFYKSIVPKLLEEIYIYTYRFNFHCYKKLKDDLGKYDSLNSLNQIAVMEFIEKLKSLENVDNINNTKSKNLYIKELTDKYSLYETGFELKIERISHYYIISTYQQAEQFFKLFLEELKPLIPNLKEKGYERKTTIIDQLLGILNIDKSDFSEKVGKHVYDSFHYYRVVGNKFRHSEESAKNKRKKEYDEHLKLVLSYDKRIFNDRFKCNIFSNLSEAPNSYDKINFNDYKLFTNVVKTIAFYLTTYVKIEEDNIIEMILSDQENEDCLTNLFFKKFNKYSDIKIKNDRIKKAFEVYYRTKFGIEKQEKVEKIYGVLKNRLSPSGI